MKDPRLEMLTAQNSVLLLVDYQPTMFKGVASGDRNAISNSAVAAAKAAKILEVPTVLTSIWPEGNGEFIKEITDIFPGQEVIARKILGFDAFEDERVLQAVKKTGRNKVVVSGLWTSMCFAYTAIHGLREGFDVYGLNDAGGDASPGAGGLGAMGGLLRRRAGLPSGRPGQQLPDGAGGVARPGAGQTGAPPPHAGGADRPGRRGR